MNYTKKEIWELHTTIWELEDKVEILLKGMSLSPNHFSGGVILTANTPEKRNRAKKVVERLDKIKE